VCPCINSRIEDISLKMISPMTRVRHIIPAMPIPLDNELSKLMKSSPIYNKLQHYYAYE
jgi:hypothetical protein